MTRREQIGDATLYLGDCLEVLPELAGAITICVADPPYSSGGLMRGDRNQNPVLKYVNGDYHSFSGDNRDQRSFTIWAAWWMGQLKQRMAASAYFLCFTDWRQLAATVDASQVAGFVYRGIIPWDKSQAVRPNRGYFRSQCEYIVWATNGPVGSKEIAPGMIYCPTPTGKERVHPTQKPVEAIQALLAIQPDGIALDPFMGSGTTGVACLQAGRKFIGIEQDAHWFDVACRRLEKAWAERALLYECHMVG